MKKALIALIALTTFSALNANASTFTLTGGTSATLPSNWTTLNWGTGLSDSSGVTIFDKTAVDDSGIFLDGPANLVYEYIGKRAGNTNTTSTTQKTDFFSTATPLSNTSYAELSSSGLLDFTFTTNGKYTGGLMGSFTNGGTFGGFGSELSMTVFKASASSLILMFGDGAGDRDFDDMVVRVTATSPVKVSAVPIPTAFWLFGSAVIGFVRLSRRSI